MSPKTTDDFDGSVSHPAGYRDCLERLYWFFRMIDANGPDDSELDALVYEEARAAADWINSEF